MTQPRQPTIEELKANHPMPWKYVIGTGGNVAVLDARSGIVPLFTILTFVQTITERIAENAVAPATAPQQTQAAT